MKKEHVIKDIEITKFVNSKDKNIKPLDLYGLLKEGNITEYYFIYKKPSNEETYRSKNIVFLDLYDKKITTENGNIYTYVNEIKKN